MLGVEGEVGPTVLQRKPTALWHSGTRPLVFYVVCGGITMLTRRSETCDQCQTLVINIHGDRGRDRRTRIVALNVAARVAPLVRDSEVDGVR